MERDWYDSIMRTLPEAQAAKLAWAIWGYYLDGKEPKLPKPAMALFEVYRPQLDFRRRNHLAVGTSGKTRRAAEEN